MKRSGWLEQWGMTGLKIKAPFLEMEWTPQDADRAAAWVLYIELLTRITSQPLAQDTGDEDTALTSVYSLFATTLHVLKSNGRQRVEFTKIAIVVLNQIVRPFTAKWHKRSTAGDFESPELRSELAAIQAELKITPKCL